MSVFCCLFSVFCCLFSVVCCVLCVVCCVLCVVCCLVKSKFENKSQLHHSLFIIRYSTFKNR
ncbi:hypothetical protein ESY86_16905 [Subsaximicrobium wynnwilliamsii]|uniref:Uncharacterized protein n=1 Tax=Subsaximicrobium wynnwilliamsii TaxID=291179 RepID=A0A5C6ZFC0_9FLAO|nr:hypothetical protein ESY87_17160 [Subsaximicrobium wynnwilliamsii]TXD87458.1 hypothetical protein ESY86_16905 [Subsaximicrobium wynnwilliamsii]TXE01146.1 hypothetical protein ESY88_17160 [Subsaximicrobium wynnwilliamsii]